MLFIIGAIADNIFVKTGDSWAISIDIKGATLDISFAIAPMIPAKIWVCICINKDITGVIAVTREAKALPNCCKAGIIALTTLEIIVANDCKTGAKEACISPHALSILFLNSSFVLNRYTIAAVRAAITAIAGKKGPIADFKLPPNPKRELPALLAIEESLLPKEDKELPKEEKETVIPDFKSDADNFTCANFDFAIFAKLTIAC